MSTPPDQHPPRDPDAPLQQQQQPASDGHAGHGSDSAMERLRDWERQRAVQSGGKRREGPG